MVGGAYAPQHRWRRLIQDACLPSHSQGYCSTHERPGNWRSSPRNQYWCFRKSIPKLWVFSVDPRRVWGVQGLLCEQIWRLGRLAFRGWLQKNWTPQLLRDPRGPQKLFQSCGRRLRSTPLLKYTRGQHKGPCDCTGLLQGEANPEYQRNSRE